MNPINYKIRLDCGKAGSQACVYVKQGDVKSRELSIFLYNNAAPYEIAEGVSAVLRAVKPDGTLVYADCTINGNVVKHLLTPQLLAAAGTAQCELTVYGSGGEVLFSPGFDVYVESPQLSDDAILSTDEFSALSAAMAEANAYKTKWSNPSATAVSGEAAQAALTLGEEGVAFAFMLPKGDKGDKGDPGVSVAIGNVTTGGPDTPASVVNAGTPSDAVLDITIPRGEKGEKGNTGDKGEKGDQGEQGIQGERGPAGADGVGIPAGGLPGQVLIKQSNTDFEVTWGNGGGGSDASITAYSVTLAAADWAAVEGGYEQTVPVATATALETCIIEAQPRDGLAAWTYDVQPVAQGAGTVTFKALHLPTADMVYGITVLNPDTVYVDTVVTAIAAHDRDAGAHANIELELTGGGV